MPAPERREILNARDNIKNKAVNSNDPPRSIIREALLTQSDECLSAMIKRDAIRQMINRARNNKAGYGFNAKCLSKVDIPENLQYTYKEEKFYWDDTGAGDKNRIILFTTAKNLALLDKYHDWLGDGTFDISPTFFKQVYSVHILVNGKSYPMAYGLLPNT